MNNLWQDFLTNNKRQISKWTHYFPAYERHFQQWQNKSLTFLEIGVLEGGSLQMWQRYFGPLAKIVGIDINPRCKEYEELNISIRIGDQSDTGFLQSIIDEFGVPDIVLDDGSHQMHHIKKTFDFLYPKMPKNSVYMVEDLHTAYWERFGGGLNSGNNFINISKNFIDELNADHSEGQLNPTDITRDTFSISYYDSICVFEKGQIFNKKAITTGN